jgi:predicted HD phosphohydrolase
MGKCDAPLRISPPPQDECQSGRTSMKTVGFTQMKDGTQPEYLFLRELEKQHNKFTADRLLRELRVQGEEESIPGYKITRLDHSLQASTRAYNEGADIDWIVGCLLHDIGDGLAPQNHDEFAAVIIRPFVREEVAWVVQHHGVFQMVYYAHHFGWNQFEREKHKHNVYYQSCVDFCERWDQSSFDPDYPTKPLEFFEPIVREVFDRKAYDPSVTRAGVVVGLPLPLGV